MPIAWQVQHLELSRSAVYYRPHPTMDADLALTRTMGIEALYLKTNTSRRHPAHRIYPYLLRGLAIDRTNPAWAVDIGALG